MKAMYNPATGMVMEWNKLRSKMDHLQEVVIPDGTPFGPYDPSVVATVPEGQARKGFPHAEEPYEGAPKTTVAEAVDEAPAKEEPPAPAKKKRTVKKKRAKKAAPAADTGDGGFGVDNL